MPQYKYCYRLVRSDHSITRSPNHPILFPALVATLLLFVASCGKKGDPQPPLPRGPRAVSDLAVEQEGAYAVVAFTYPDRLLNGQPLTDLAAVEVYRVLDPAPGFSTKPAPAAAKGPTIKTDEAPGAGARRTAMNLRVTEENFYREAKKIDTLSVAALAQQTRGAQIVYHDALAGLLAETKAPGSLGYAVVSVRRGGERSPLSNLATLAPAVPPGPPSLLDVAPEPGRICLEWLEPEADLLGHTPVKVGGYFVYRRNEDDDEYGQPLNAKPLDGTAFVDVAPPYGTLVYTVRATVPEKPKVEGAPAVEAGVDYRDVFPPPAPARLDALPEGKIVRLVWDPVAAPDLEGYAVYRADGSGPPERLNKEFIKESFVNDTTAQPGHRYRYTVRAVDKAGNQSASSPEATAEVF
ncbi:MAG TPA: hypothetical protein VKJ00_00340 [Thermoanaerobaculia bacterium]|nr:hypothetical protein [Thermoanaerobaculia bacterium]